VLPPKLCVLLVVQHLPLLVSYVALLPYRRNQYKKNLLCVADEKCGTCSTKHVLLKKVAEEHGHDEIHLVIGIFLLNQHNTPKAKSILNSFYLRGFPEAHCYLTFDAKIYDFTFPSGSFNFAHDLLEEHVVTADEVATKKLGLHKQFMRNWQNKNKYHLHMKSYGIFGNYALRR
jgi:hypothetical protein